MELCVLLLLVIPGCLAQQDLEGKVFIFPKETNTAHVLLRPTMTNPLEKVSVCLHSYTDLSRPYSLFSLATPRMSNAFVIYVQPPDICSVYINQEEIFFTTDPVTLDWRHICVTWDSHTQALKLWVNGKLYVDVTSVKGSSIASNTKIVLGQDQDSFGGGFNAGQSFVGQLCDIHMWDYVLTPKEVQKVSYGGLRGNVINWKSLVYEMKGEVLLKPKVWQLKNKVFVFPKETNTAHVLLRPSLSNPLEKLSVCLRSYTDLSRPYSLFSLATPGKDDAFLIFLRPPNTCSVYLNQEEILFTTDPESLNWRHTCVTWDSITGVVQLWVNGKFYPRRVSKKESSISYETSIVLGQEQDSFGGGFEAHQSFIGEISDLHMWDYALTSGDIQKVVLGDLHGNVISWDSLSLEMKGEVLLLPKP